MDKNILPFSVEYKDVEIDKFGNKTPPCHYFYYNINGILHIVRVYNSDSDRVFYEKEVSNTNSYASIGGKQTESNEHYFKAVEANEKLNKFIDEQYR